MRPLCLQEFRFWHCYPQPVSHPLEQPVVARYRSWSMHSYSCVYDVSSVTSISGGVPTASWPAVSKDLYTRVTVATYITMHVPEIYAHLLKESFAEFVMTKPWPPCWTQMCVAMCFFLQVFTGLFPRTFQTLPRHAACRDVPSATRFLRTDLGVEIWLRLHFREFSLGRPVLYLVPLQFYFDSSRLGQCLPPPVSAPPIPAVLTVKSIVPSFDRP
jgi:hypothetical protein